MKKLYSLLISFSLTILGCQAALQLQRTVPADKAGDIAINSKIVLIFNENAHPGEGICRLNGKELTPAISGKYITFTPDFEYLTEYTFVAEDGAFINASGQPSGEIQFTFTTAGPTPRLFDAIVAADSTGNYTSVQEAIDNAPANRTTPWLIFIKKGVYNELIRVPSNKPYMHLIGEDLESTIIQYKINCAGDSSDPEAWKYSGNRLGVSDGSVVVVSAPHFYTENISYINTWGHEHQKGPQALVFKTFQDRFIANHCKMLSFQDTWQTSGRNDTDRHYAKNCFIEGAVDFIYCSGDCYFETCTLSIARSRGAVIVAPSHNGAKWGYVFMDCVIDAPRTSTEVYFGRPWHNSPKASFVNTRLSKKISLHPAGWIDHMGAIPAIFADYNTSDHNGKPVDMSKRIDTYWYTDSNGKRVEGKAKKSLTDEEVAQLTLKNVLGGKDNWRPDFMTTAPATPTVSYDGKDIMWEKIGLAICYIVSKNGNAIAYTTDHRFSIDDASAAYTVRAVGEFGALSEMSKTLVPAGMEQVSSHAQARIYVQGGRIFVKDIEGKTDIQLYSLSGALLLQKEVFSDTSLPLPEERRCIIQITSDKQQYRQLL